MKEELVAPPNGQKHNGLCLLPSKRRYKVLFQP